MAEPIVDRERCHDQRTPRAVRRKYGSRRAIFEESRNVVQIANVRIVDNRMSVVEVKCVAEVVRINADHQHAQRHTERSEFLTRLHTGDPAGHGGQPKT